VYKINSFDLRNKKGYTNDMFMPAYTRIGRLVDGDNVAKRAGIAIGDIVVAVNGTGFRRFPPDFQDHELEDLTIQKEAVVNIQFDEKAKERKAQTITGLKDGEHYNMMLAKIKEIKKARDPSNALHLSMERYDWDSRVNSWPRFLMARSNDVKDAMKMMQMHEAWKANTFPIDLTDPGIQTVLKAKAVSEFSISSNVHTSNGAAAPVPPTVYINFQKLQNIPNLQASDVSKAFVIFTEAILKQCKDPRRPKSYQLIDLTGVTISGGLRSDILRDIYNVFEPNYPETLDKMVMYPVPKLAQNTAKLILNFVNENTREKFVMTDHLNVVCHELGWDYHEVQSLGSIENYIQKHSRAAANMVFD